MSSAHRVSSGHLKVCPIFLYILVCGSSLVSARPPIIQDAAEISDGETPEDQTVVSPYSPVVRLNRHTFAGNVERADSMATAEHWVVFFCADWYAPCQALLPHFVESGTRWQEELNEGRILKSHVRFARVDCAVDKPLCNTQGVEAYPTVVHYTEGQLAADWSANGRSDEQRLEKWLARELVARTAKVPARVSSAADLAARVPCSEHAANLGMVVVLAALNYWVIRQQVGADSLEEKQVLAAPEPKARATTHGAASWLPSEWAAEHLARMEL